MTVFQKLWSRIARPAFPLGVLCSAGVVIALQGSFLVALAQSNPQPAPNSSKSPARKKYKLKIQEGAVIGVSLKADKAPLADIASDLAKGLKTRVVLGPGMEKQLVTMEFVDLPLSVALQLLAPRVYVDYEIRSGAPPAPMGILLFAFDDPIPAATALVTGDSQGLLIEGNTEENAEGQSTDKDKPLQVKLDGDRLTVKSKKQPLTAVVLTVAEVLGVPAEIKYDSTEIVDAEMDEVLLEDAIPTLSPNVRLFVRADLAHSKRTPLRIKLVAPEKSATQ